MSLPPTYWQPTPLILINLADVVAILVAGPFPGPATGALNGQASKHWAVQVATRSSGLVPAGTYASEDLAHEKLIEGAKALVMAGGGDPDTESIL